MNNSCSFTFDIADWHALSSRMATRSEWQQWAEGGLQAENLPEYKPTLDFLPAMQRRRLAYAARLMCQAAWPLADTYPDMPLVFASHDGEINRSFELWPELLRSQTVSPTSFGLSVHNALPGQWSIQRKDTQENTALATLSDGIETALAESYALLQEGAERVLLIVADDPLKPEYAVQAERAPFPYALAMVLQQGNRYRLSLTKSESATPNNADYAGALAWIRFMLGQETQVIRQYDKQRRWLWQKS